MVVRSREEVDSQASIEGRFKGLAVLAVLAVLAKWYFRHLAARAPVRASARPVLGALVHTWYTYGSIPLLVLSG